MSSLRIFLLFLKVDFFLVFRTTLLVVVYIKKINDKQTRTVFEIQDICREE